LKTNKTLLEIPNYHKSNTEVIKLSKKYSKSCSFGQVDFMDDIEEGNRVDLHAEMKLRRFL